MRASGGISSRLGPDCLSALYARRSSSVLASESFGLPWSWCSSCGRAKTPVHEDRPAPVAVCQIGRPGQVAVADPISSTEFSDETLHCDLGPGVSLTDGMHRARAGRLRDDIGSSGHCVTASERPNDCLGPCHVHLGSELIPSSRRRSRVLPDRYIAAGFRDATSKEGTQLIELNPFICKHLYRVPKRGLEPPRA